MTFCKSCGRQYPDTSKFCTGCGVDLKSITMKEESVSYPASRNNLKPLLITVAIFLAAGAGSYFVFFNKKKSKDISAVKQDVLQSDSATRTKDESKTTPPISANKKTITLRFVSYEFGDLAHYTFTDNNSGEEQNFSHYSFDEKTTAKWESAIYEIAQLCEGSDNCKLKGQLYNVEMEYKINPGYDMAEDGVVKKTGERSKDWVVTRLTKLTKNTEATASYLSPSFRLVFQSDCYIIVTGSFTYEADAKKEISRMRNNGYSNAGYLWIPDYPSLSEKPFYAPFLGPYESYESCKTALSELRKTGRFWYGVKVSNNPQRIEIRL